MSHALLLPKPPPLVGIAPPSPPSGPVEKALTAEQVAQATLDAMLTQSPLTPEKQFAVALNVAVLALARMPGLRMARGRYIKAALDDFKSKMQRYLPRAEAPEPSATDDSDASTAPTA